MATSLENYFALLREATRAEEAERLEARAKAIRAKQEQERALTSRSLRAFSRFPPTLRLRQKVRAK